MYNKVISPINIYEKKSYGKRNGDAENLQSDSSSSP